MATLVNAVALGSCDFDAAIAPSIRSEGLASSAIRSALH